MNDKINFINELAWNLVDLKLKTKWYNLEQANKDLSIIQKSTWEEIDVYSTWLYQKWINKIETKAWEVIETWTVWYWQELKFSTYNDFIVSIAEKQSWLLNFFSQWNLNTTQWRLMWDSHKIVYDWVRKRMTRSTPRTSWPIVAKTPSKIQTFTDLEIKRQRLNSIVDVSSNLLDNNILWENWILSYVTSQITRQLIESIDYMILNSDISLTTTNINTEWLAPASDEINAWVVDWIRKLWITNSFDYLNWALSESAFQKALEQLSQMWDQDVFFIISTLIWNKMLWISPLSTLDKIWPRASITTWIVNQIYWREIFISPEYADKQQASWLISNTTWSNTVWSIVGINKRALQYWFFGNDVFQINKDLKEVSIWFATDFWFWIIPEIANYWKTVSMVRNIAI